MIPRSQTDRTATPDPFSISAEEAIAPGVRRRPAVLGALAISAAAVGLLLAIGAIFSRGGTFQFDRTIMLSLRRAGAIDTPAGPAWLRSVMVDITALGGTTVLTLAVIVAVLIMASRRLWLTAAMVAAASISGSFLVTQIKVFVGRTRPDIVDHLVDVSGMSFPSGHATNSAIVYLILATLASQVVHGRYTRNVLIGCAVVLVGAIGCSRVYLGVHWPSDVLAGWSFGTLWAGAWWLLAARFRPAAPPAPAPTPAHP